MLRKFIMYIRPHQRFFIIPKIQFGRNKNFIIVKYDWVILISILFLTIEIGKTNDAKQYSKNFKNKK